MTTSFRCCARSCSTGEHDLSDVDASADPAQAVQWQLRVDQWPQIMAYKRRIRELLADAESVVDIGCGPGRDILAIGADRCVGVDRSARDALPPRSKARTSAERMSTSCRSPTASSQGSVADRVLQHVDDPARAIAEMVRVLGRGGRVVIADPDQETLGIHVPGVRRELIDRVKALRRDIGYRHGRLVSSMPESLAAIGIGDVSVDPFALCLTDPHDAFGIPGWPRLWQRVGGFSDDDLREWDQGMNRSQGGGFVYSLVYLVVSGVRP